MGTAFLLMGLLVTGATLQGVRASEMGHYAAVGVIVSLAASVVMDVLERGVRNLIRADLMAMLSLYFLTLIEFFSKQEAFNDLVTTRTAANGIDAVLWGFAGLATGRHLFHSSEKGFYDVFTKAVSAQTMMRVFWFCFLVGYSDQFASCRFNPVTVFEAYLDPRFSQPWTRGQLGDWRSFFTELELLIYLIPPLAGVMLARRKNYQATQLAIVSIGLAWTLTAGFLSGTRNLFDCYMITFLIAYISGTGRGHLRQLAAIGAICVVLLVVSTKLAVQFREVGFLNFVTGNMEQKPPEEEGLYVDSNLYVICGLTEVFPKRVAYLGWQVPYLAVIRPIPRALWPGKPEGLSTGIEKALGIEGLTLASSFVGEAYMAFGNAGVFFAGFLFGMLARWWVRFGHPLNSDLGILIYASGFFAASISMRSLFVFTTAILPTMAAIIGTNMLLKKRRERETTRGAVPVEALP
jgi:hypothetical protein